MLTVDDLHALMPKLEQFHARFHRFFQRSESRVWGLKYLFGLMLPIERRNVENIAEQVNGSPRRLQEFLSDSPWDDKGCIEELQRLVGEELGEADGCVFRRIRTPSPEFSITPSLRAARSADGGAS